MISKKKETKNQLCILYYIIKRQIRSVWLFISFYLLSRCVSSNRWFLNAHFDKRNRFYKATKTRMRTQHFLVGVFNFFFLLSFYSGIFFLVKSLNWWHFGKLSRLAFFFFFFLRANTWKKTYTEFISLFSIGAGLWLYYA